MGLVDSGDNIVLEYKYDARDEPTLKRSLTTAYDAPGNVASTVATTSSASDADEASDAERSSIPVIFSPNPNDFNSIGLIREDHPGTKNGRIVTWMDPVMRVVVFRWDENSIWPNGPHYHIIPEESNIYPLEVCCARAIRNALFFTRIISEEIICKVLARKIVEK